MDIPKKLQVIKQATSLTQTKLAERLGVSFVTLIVGGQVNQSLDQKYKNSLMSYFRSNGRKNNSAGATHGQKQVLKKSGEYKKFLSKYSTIRTFGDTFLLKLTYNSNKIEGSTLTEPDTRPFF